MNLHTFTLADLTNKDGALARLKHRFGHAVSHDSLRQYVRDTKLRALQFEDGTLIVRTPTADTRGKDMFFLLSDLDAMPVPARPGKPKGAKNKPK